MFGEHARKLAISSTKSMTGHMMGAAGAFEGWASVKVLDTGWIPPTINLNHPDPALTLDYVPHTARQSDVKVALSNSMGLGGHNGNRVPQVRGPRTSSRRSSGAEVREAGESANKHD